MADFALARFQRRHNLRALAKGTGYLILAAIFWFVSFWLIKGIFFLLALLWGSIWNWYPSGRLTSYVGWGGVVLLAVEGLRYGKTRLDLLAYADSIYATGFTGTEQEVALHVLTGRPLGVAYLVSQFLFCAPRFTTRAVLAVLSVVTIPETSMAAAQAIVDDLRRRKAWTPALEYRAHGDILRRLDKMGVVRHRVHGTVVEVRTDTET